jgi:preprotein translocase subunit SecD
VITTTLAMVFGAVALILGGWGYAQRTKRVALWIGGLCAAIAAGCAYYDAFWGMVLLALGVVWALIGATRLVDTGWRMRAGVVVCTTLLGLFTLWPTASSMSDGAIPIPEYVRERVQFKLVAGLDLRGGMRLVYTVDVQEAIRDRRDRRYEEMRAELAKLFELHTGDDRPTEAVYAKLREFVTLTPSRTDASALTLELKPTTDVNKIDARFLNVFSGELAYRRSDDQRTYNFKLKEESSSQIRETAVAQAKDIVLRRVDELGLREAAVSTRDEDIIVEVPGKEQAEFDEIREIIGQTARLEFKLLDDDADFFASLSRDPNAQLPEGIDIRAHSVPLGQDAEGEAITASRSYAALDLKEGESSKDGLARFKAWAETLNLPPDRELGYELVRDTDPDTQQEKEVGWITHFLKSRAEITGDMVRDAQAVPDQSSASLGGWYVALTFTDSGGSTFERITGENIKRRFAIILDDRVESAPVIQDRIAGGHATITMGASDPAAQLRDSRKLELVLRSGALPAPITPSNEQHIGPSLGQSAIELGVKGALLGAIAVIAFMFVYYRRGGTIANIAVILNLMLQMATLATFGASMTLPGIAGLALTIGMSVDANVLINERIREELRDGRSPRAAVELGYNKALSGIIDGHLTTLISAVVLAQFGTGPIKGFAVTLIVGVTISIFTGVVVTRLLFDLWVRRMSRTSKLELG